MDGQERFSVYSVGHAAAGDGPLANLRGDYDHGWHVARNLLKPLNHLAFLRRKEEIALRLNLHSTATPPAVFDANYRLLEAHQQRRISIAALLEHLAAQLGAQGRPLSPAEIRALLQEYATADHVEFHPCDACNLACRGCTYGHDDPATKPAPVSFPYEELRTIARLRPRSMLISGGGEPTLYRSGPYRFQHVVDALAEQSPGLTLALTTNGTHQPPGRWPDRVSWLRISLDSASAQTYRQFRGRPLFDRAVQHFLGYLDYGVPHVGVSFLFARSNIHEYAEVARFIYDLGRREKLQHLAKVNIQYRPLRRDPHDYGRPFAEAITAEQIQATVQAIVQLAAGSRAMEAFLREQTNVTAILGGNSHPPYGFARCYYSQVFKIVRANGDLRPCFIRVNEPEFLLGNLLRDPMEAIALNTLYVGARRHAHCDPHGCRQCHVNYVFEQGLQGRLEPPASSEVRADPMY